MFHPHNCLFTDLIPRSFRYFRFFSSRYIIFQYISNNERAPEEYLLLFKQSTHNWLTSLTSIIPFLQSNFIENQASRACRANHISRNQMKHFTWTDISKSRLMKIPFTTLSQCYVNYIVNYFSWSSDEM